MYSKTLESPLNLYLDPKNPRFIIPETGSDQLAIRKYLITQENVLVLARSIVENNGLMPGERIVVFPEEDKYIVLEGNRRTCTYQMLLDRSLIPDGFESKVPVARKELLEEITELEIDVIKSREEARRFLAVRHIERAKEWSTIAKMRFCYEDYCIGKTISEINERTGLANGTINKFIRHYNILLRGINSSWTEEEKKKLDLLNIRPDKLLRLFTLTETSKALQLYYDKNFVLRSTKINDYDLNEIIHIWTQKAFIDEEIDTRTNFDKDVEDSKAANFFINHILERYTDSKPEHKANNAQESSTKKSSEANKGQEEAPSTQGSSTSDSSKPTAQGGGPKNLPFFSTLDWTNVDPAIQSNKGVIAICSELKKISAYPSFIYNYPICTAFQLSNTA